MLYFKIPFLSFLLTFPYCTGVAFVHPNKTSEVHHPDSDPLKLKRGTVVGIEQIKGEMKLPLFSHFFGMKTAFS